MKRITGLILLISLAYPLFSQEEGKGNSEKDSADNAMFCFKYSVSEEYLSTINESELSEHFLGINIAKKFHLFRDTYTYIEAPTPTSPGEKTVVVKPSIYNSLIKLNRHYKKQVKKGLITKEEASEKLNHYLDIALSVFVEDTDTFEAKLRKAKKPDEISNVFSLVELK